MAKAEIGWVSRDETGAKRQVYVHHVGTQWLFYQRAKRFDPWQRMDQPALEDWLALLDGVRRRIDRRLIKPEEEARIIKAIKEQFPEALV